MVEAIHEENYHLFFLCFKASSKHAKLILKTFVEESRIKALKTMVKSYRPSIEILYIKQELGFDAAEECRQWLENLKVVFDATGAFVLCKESLNVIQL